MTLTEGESKKAYEVLATRSKEVGLQWVLSQVEDKINLGKVSLKKVPFKEHPMLPDVFQVQEDRRGRRRQSSAVFVASEEYTPQEQLRILIEALLAAVPSVHEIASATLHTMKEIGECDNISFAAEGGVNESFKVDAPILNQTRDGVEHLKRLLKELLVEVGDARQE